MRHKAAAAGRSVGVYAQRILDVPLPWTSMRSVYRLLGLCRTYGPAAVDAACARALELDVIDIKKITRILEQAIEAQPTLFPAKVVGGSTHCARDNTEYRSEYRSELRAGQPAATALFDPLLERMALAKQQSLPYADFLSLVFADEVERRDRTSADLRSRTAKLDLAVRNRVVQQRQPGPVTTANSGTNCAR